MVFFFKKSLLISGKTGFLQILADFVTGFESSSDKDVHRCKEIFYSSSGSGNIREKHKFQNQLDVYFCYSLSLYL